MVKENAHEPTFLQEFNIWQIKPQLLYAETFSHKGFWTPSVHYIENIDKFIHVSIE